MKRIFFGLLISIILPVFVFPKVVKTIPSKPGNYTYQSLKFLKDTTLLYGHFDNTKLNKIYAFFDNPNELLEVKAISQGEYDRGYNLLIDYPGITSIVYQKNDELYLCIENQTFGPYTTVRTPTYAMDTNYYWYPYSIGSEHYVYANGKTYGPYQERIEFFKYALNNPSQFVFAFKKDNKIYVHYAGQTLGPYPSVEPSISPDGKHIAVVYAFPNKNPGYYVRIDDKIAGPYKFAEFPYFSPDSKGYWYSYQTADGYGGYVINGADLQKFAGSPGKVRFSKLNHQYAFVSKGEDGMYVQYEDSFAGPYSDVGSVVFSVDGSTLAFLYVLRKNYKEEFYLWVNGKVSGPFNYISCLGFAPDGKSLVYIEEHKNGESYFVYGDKRFGPMFVNSITSYNFVFSPDGKHLAYFYWTLDKKQKKPAYMKYDDKIYGPYYYADQPAFSPDGKHFYFTFNNKPNDHALWIDGKEITPGAFFISDVKFSPDSQKFAFKIEKTEIDTDTYFYYKGKTYGPYPWGTDFNFSAENHLMVAYLNKKKDMIYIEDMDIE
jgi:hypothetical protein